MFSKPELSWSRKRTNFSACPRLLTADLTIDICDGIKHSSAEVLRPVTEKNVTCARSYLSSLSATFCRLHVRSAYFGGQGCLTIPALPLYMAVDTYIVTCVYGDEKRLAVLPSIETALAIIKRGENWLFQRISEDSQQALWWPRVTFIYTAWRPLLYIYQFEAPVSLQ